MTSTTFCPKTTRPDIAENLCPRTKRLESGVLIPDPMVDFPLNREDGDATGGGGIYTTADDYIKVLESLLLNDGRLLGSEMVDEMFKPRVHDTEEVQAEWSTGDDAIALVADSEYASARNMKWNFGLGGLQARKAVRGSRRRGLCFGVGRRIVIG